MTAFSVVVSFDGSPAPEGRAANTLETLRFRGFDSKASRCAPGADAAIHVREVDDGDLATAGIFVDSLRQWLVVGDVRLYDREELRRRVGSRIPQSDLGLVSQAYASFGDAGLAGIHGDFAVVIWDWSQRSLHLIRDHFGLRSLFFRRTAPGMMVASDVRPLLESDSDLGETLDETTVMDYLLGDIAHHGRSFFKQIGQVRPGHVMQVRSQEVALRRFWNPPDKIRNDLTYADMVGEWKDTFARAVAARLTAKHPTASYLSGGLDSGSIVGVAHREYRRTPAGRPPMFTLSARFPGLPCDETELIRTATRDAPDFRALTWDGGEPNVDDFLSPNLVMPGLRLGIGWGPTHELAQIHAHGIRMVLSGFGGDELGWSHGYFRDLVEHGNILELLRQLSMMSSWQRAIHHFRVNIRGVAAAYEPRGLPGWAGPSLQREFAARTPEYHAEGLEFDSFSQEQTWAISTLPAAAWATDITRTALNESGAELRLPYRDLKLVEFVLQIPWRLRRPRGNMRQLQRDAVAQFLSPEVARETGKVLAGSAVSHQIRSGLAQVTSILSGSKWTLDPLVSQAGSRLALNALVKSDPGIRNARAWLPVWRIAVLEAWNRARLNYHGRRRNIMQDVKVVPNAISTVDILDREHPYEAPSLVLIGNVRDLVTATFGPSFDPGAPADGRSAT